MLDTPIMIKKRTIQQDQRINTTAIHHQSPTPRTTSHSSSAASKSHCTHPKIRSSSIMTPLQDLKALSIESACHKRCRSIVQQVADVFFPSAVSAQQGTHPKVEKSTSPDKVENKGGTSRLDLIRVRLSTPGPANLRFNKTLANSHAISDENHEGGDSSSLRDTRTHVPYLER